MEKYLSMEISKNDGSGSNWLKLHELKANSLKWDLTGQFDVCSICQGNYLLNLPNVLIVLLRAFTREVQFDD